MQGTFRTDSSLTRKGSGNDTSRKVSGNDTSRNVAETTLAQEIGGNDNKGNQWEFLPLSLFLFLWGPSTETQVSYKNDTRITRF